MPESETKQRHREKLRAEEAFKKKKSSVFSMDVICKVLYEVDLPYFRVGQFEKNKRGDWPTALE